MTRKHGDRSTLFFTLPLALLLCSCATARPVRTCPISATQGVPVDWRLFTHPACGSTWIVDGGSRPKLPNVRFPITEEAVVRDKFVCSSRGDPVGDREPVALGVNFETERLERIGLGINGQISSVVQTEQEIVVQVNSTTYCGGITPEQIAEIIVIPKDAPPVRIKHCMSGAQCHGPPRV